MTFFSEVGYFWDDYNGINLSSNFMNMLVFFEKMMRKGNKTE